MGNRRGDWIVGTGNSGRIVRRVSLGNQVANEIAVRRPLGPSALDNDGAPKWYVRKALEESMASLAEAISGLKDVLRELHNDQKNIQKSMDRMEKHVEQL